MRFAVLGAAGQLGRDICSRLSGEVIALSRAELDLADLKAIPAVIAATHADVLINCAAYNLVDRAETEPELAFAVNTWAVRALARACHAAEIKLVHFSSDYVFGLDTTRITPYAESDPPGPVNVYGLSKLAGEYLVRAECPEALVIRTCGLYGSWGSGGKGRNFVETMLRLAAEGRELRVVDDQHCTPSYTVDVAEATLSLIRVGATGLFHVTNAGSCTWFEFACEIFRQAELKPDLKSITSVTYGAAARRPAYSVLSNQKLTVHGIPARRLWTEALAAYLVERQKRRE